MAHQPTLSKLLRRSVVLITLAALLPAPRAGVEAAPNVRRLSQALPSWGSVASYQISPDGVYAVYQVDDEVDGSYNLFSVGVNSGSPVKLNPLLPSTSDVFAYNISPDSSRVVYVANQDSAECEIYSVPITGPASAVVKLNQALPGTDNISCGTAPLITPDSSRAVFLAEMNTDNVRELYSVPVIGPASAAVKLNGTLVAGGNLVDFDISPNGSQVVYRADQQVDSTNELYSVPVGGPSAAGVKLSGGMPVVGYDISPNSGRVVFRAVASSTVCLFSAPVAGGEAPVQLHTALVTGGQVSDFAITPDSSRVIFDADLQIATKTEVFSTPIAGPAAEMVRLNLPIGSSDDAWIGLDLAEQPVISPNGSRLIYSMYTKPAGHDQTDIYSVPSPGPATASIPLAYPLGSWAMIGMRVTSDSSRLLYLVGGEDAEGIYNQLFSVPMAGPANTAVAVTDKMSFADGNFPRVRFSPDGSRFAVVVNPRGDDSHYHLYMGSTSGTPDSVVEVATVLSLYSPFEFLPDNSRLVYAAAISTPGKTELYVTDDGKTTVGLSLLPTFVSESAGSVNVQVRLNQAAALPVTVHYATSNNTATAGADYTAASGDLVFAPGVTLQSVNIAILEDALAESNERFSFTLSAPQNAALASRGWSTTVTIIDNDKHSTTTTITGHTPEPSVVGQTVAVTVSVSSGIPRDATTGSVTVQAGTDSCTGTLSTTLSGERASCTLTLTERARYDLVAEYSGDAEHNGSVSTALVQQRVVKASTNTTITAHDPDPVDVGYPATVGFSVAVVSPGAGQPTGQVTVSDGAQSCTGDLAAGECVLYLTTPGTRSLVATYLGDANFAASSSPGTSHMVNAHLFLPLVRR